MHTYLLSADVPDLARGFSKFKERSFETAKVHLLDLTQETKPVSVVLFGDSMIERMLTTGHCQNFKPWPSETMLPETDLQALNDARRNVGGTSVSRKYEVANFGCGGDKIENMLYRLVGDANNDLKGLVLKLSSSKGGMAARKRQKLWVVQAGSNNLHSKKGLTDASLKALDILLRLLFQANDPGSKFLLTGLFYRKDVPNDLVDKANTAMKELVAKLEKAKLEPSNNSASPARLASDHHLHEHGTPTPLWDRADGTFRFLPAPEMDVLDTLFEDHVHLNESGYRKWMQTLLPKVDEMLRPAPPSNSRKSPDTGVAEKHDAKPRPTRAPPVNQQGTHD